MAARVKTQLRRYRLYNHSAAKQGEAAREYDIRGLVINRDSHKCFLFGNKPQMISTQFAILWYLCERQGVVVPSEELFEAVWSEKFLQNNNTVMAHIGRLREKMREPARNPRFIKTVWGLVIPLKNRKDFCQLRIKIFLRTIAALVTAVSVIYITYSVLLRGRFADGMVALFQTAFGVKQDAALQLYDRIFRSHMDAMILFSIERRLTCRLAAADDIPLKCDADNTERGSGGTGLGLAIARQIVTLHKGAITAESENERTVFTVTLPVL